MKEEQVQRSWGTKEPGLSEGRERGRRTGRAELVICRKK
jgi:hypothetical protein